MLSSTRVALVNKTETKTGCLVLLRGQAYTPFLLDGLRNEDMAWFSQSTTGRPRNRSSWSCCTHTHPLALLWSPLLVCRQCPHTPHMSFAAITWQSCDYRYLLGMCAGVNHAGNPAGPHTESILYEVLSSFPPWLGPLWGVSGCVNGSYWKWFFLLPLPSIFLLPGATSK